MAFPQLGESYYRFIILNYFKGLKFQSLKIIGILVFEKKIQEDCTKYRHVGDLSYVTKTILSKLSFLRSSNQGQLYLKYDLNRLSGFRGEDACRQ